MCISRERRNTSALCLWNLFFRGNYATTQLEPAGMFWNASLSQGGVQTTKQVIGNYQIIIPEMSFNGPKLHPWFSSVWNPERGCDDKMKPLLASYFPHINIGRKIPAILWQFNIAMENHPF